MIRKVIHIDEDKCNGCGICAKACHEGAIGIIDGKAKLLRDDYCDGMGDCLPTCPTGAISFTEREAAAYNEDAVREHKQQGEDMQKQTGTAKVTAKDTVKGAVKVTAKDTVKGAVKITSTGGGCPGTRVRTLERRKKSTEDASAALHTQYAEASSLINWPVQIKLAPVRAPYFEGAQLLIAADCTAYAYPAFHQDFMQGKVTCIACPKLDAVDYSEKLTSILQSNTILDVTIVRMEVPCCGGLVNAVKKALQACGKDIPCHVVTISTDGNILD